MLLLVLPKPVQGAEEMTKDIIYGLIPGGILLLAFLIGLAVEFLKPKKPKFWVEFDENGDLMF